jgi:hypothetical protein
MTDRQLLLHIIDCAFNQQSWHGPNLRSSLRVLKAADASKRIGARKSIREQVLHAAYWKQRIASKLGARAKLPWKGKNWMTPGAAKTQAAWREDIRQLEIVHQRFRQAVAAAPNLDKKMSWRIFGVALHDAYHAGQING